jgi:hypothetical protein
MTRTKHARSMDMGVDETHIDPGLMMAVAVIAPLRAVSVFEKAEGGTSC